MCQPRTPGLYSRLTPLASTSVSPIRSRVRKVDDIPARFLSRNSMRLKCAPTETISSAPFSWASSIATSWLVPIAGATTGFEPELREPLPAGGVAVRVGVHHDLGPAA